MGIRWRPATRRCWLDVGPQGHELMVATREEAVVSRETYSSTSEGAAELGL